MYYLLVSFFLVTTTLPAQSGWGLCVSAGYARGGSADYVPSQRAQALHGTATVYYRRQLLPAWALEVGLGGRGLLSYGEFDGERYRGAALRLYLPLTLDYRIGAGPWSVIGGYALQNERDLAGLDNRRGAVLRHWARTGARYRYRERWTLEMTAQTTVNDIPAFFYVADPRYALGIGINYHLWKTSDE